MDANIFVSKTISDWLYLLKETNPGIVRFTTSVDVMVEALAAIRHKHPRALGGLIAQRLNQFGEIASVILEEFPSDVEFSGADEGDYHVHAATVTSSADVLVTSNHPRDFGAVPYEVLHPDELLVRLVVTLGCELDEARRLQRHYWRGSPKSLEQALWDAGCPRFAELVI